MISHAFDIRQTDDGGFNCKPPGGDHRRPTPLGRSRPDVARPQKIKRSKVGVVWLSKFSARSSQDLGMISARSVFSKTLFRCHLAPKSKLGDSNPAVS